MDTTNTPKPFATVDDLADVCPCYDETKRKRADKLLALVSAIIRAQCSDYKSIDPEVLTFVVCQAVSRALQAGTETPIGATSESWGAAPFSGSVSYANPTGDIYFTAFEKHLLGIGTTEMYFINQKVGS
ncbi:Gp19/Gp15/Gp42 family protein [Atopobium deltae]|uniref:Phage protein Gp19/Gp15/Gp42 n=1 Tax=Atopobium deltae TaxID=1393034 RepID=A0A133XTX2_9ACTN|nr:Gp19/Gp15/Gp42 family protein [Atopobium deltae]KXB34383.1 hypothetical protein HMPREF3192_00935 [Atopobium deltae]